MNWSPKPRFKRPEILLHPNIPKPMHTLAPRVVLGTEWWDKERKQAADKNNQCCWACGVHKNQAEEKQWLEGHEFYEMDYARGRMVYKECVSLCHFCHNYIHSGRLQMLRDKREISLNLFNRINQHGDKLIKEAGLKRKQFNGKIAEWKDWRLVVDGKEYKPMIGSYKEWCDKFVPAGSLLDVSEDEDEPFDNEFFNEQKF